MEIFLSLETQNLLFKCQRVFFTVTTILNAISLICLIKITSPNQKRVRGYLLYIQVLIITSSVYLDVLFLPIPAFPAIAGYCLGKLCMTGLSPHSILGVFMLIILLIISGILSCSFYRHQTVIPVNNTLLVSEELLL
ncbi:hypothetical protein PMAYCL1PPCAC_32758 [Pristionchus mayeri]|uniref:G protein-coupled receptor n=1 Tax=Pristionchus mayeri TaxID=1317129 RepID=A0AAN5IDR4_9BILA|nr:hypothetical protein PMAYCL1PPCAC_32758 [Pristionchus mayeri]